MNTAAHRPKDVRSARRAFLLVGLLVPIVIALVGVVLILIWLPDLPDQVVTHWGADGPDGFGSPDIYVWMQLLVGVGIPLLMTLPVLAMTGDSWGGTARFLGAASLGGSALVTVASAGSVATQRGGSDGSGIGVVFAIGFSAMLVLGVIGWFVQPRVTTAQPAGDVAQLILAPGEKAAWFGTAAMGRPGIVVLILAVGLLISSTIWMTALGESSAVWITVIVTVLVLALIAMTLIFRVQVNSAGLSVRSVVGWPRWNISTSEIADVQVVHVNPMAEFGGWGLRIAVDGRRGVVLRTGEALQVTRHTGRVFVVTIDDAATAASVLSAAVKGVKS